MTALNQVHKELLHADRGLPLTTGARLNGNCLVYLKQQQLRASQENVDDKVNRVPVVFGDYEKQGKNEKEAPEQHEPRVGLSHLRDLQNSTITLPEENCTTGSEERTKVPKEVAVWIEDLSTSMKETTTHTPTPSKLQHLYFWLCFLICFFSYVVIPAFYYFLS
ncbi:hypothetical protein MHYP_G00258900 [Metynnis hypsauchen]